jgi:hypothetical protein
MTDLTKLLQEADPVRSDGELSPAEAQSIRRAMLAAAREPSGSFSVWRRPLAVAALVALLIGIGGVPGHRTSEPEADPARMASHQPDGGSSVGNDRRQLQFATPGGTRIIWIFDDNLRLQESMP